MVRNPIPVALNAFVSGLAVVMTVFTIADISSGSGSTAVYIGVVMWPVVALAAGVAARMLQRDKEPVHSVPSEP